MQKLRICETAECMFKVGKDLRLPACTLDQAQCNSPIRPILAGSGEIGQNSLQWVVMPFERAVRNTA